MSREEPCVEYEHKGDLEGCVTRHVTITLKLLDKEKPRKAKGELASLGYRLKEIE